MNFFCCCHSNDILDQIIDVSGIIPSIISKRESVIDLSSIYGEKTNLYDILRDISNNQFHVLNVRDTFLNNEVAGLESVVCDVVNGVIPKAVIEAVVFILTKCKVPTSAIDSIVSKLTSCKIPSVDLIVSELTKYNVPPDIILLVVSEISKCNEPAPLTSSAVVEPVAAEPLVEQAPLVAEPKVVASELVEPISNIVDEPVVVEPAAAVEEPAVVEPAVAQPVAQVVVVEEPLVAEPKLEQPVVVEPVVVEQVVAADEPDEITTLRPFVADPKTLFQPISKSQLDPIYSLEDL